MSVKIVVTANFKREAKKLIKKYRSLKEELSELDKGLQKMPTTGILITENVYKIRLAIKSKGKGKSGGARVITYLYIETETVYLLTIYDKGEKADLKPNELKEMINNLDLGN